jgi:hypothetical protein
MSYTKTTYADTDRNGAYDYMQMYTVDLDSSGRTDLEVTQSDHGADGSIDRVIIKDSDYDDLGRLSLQALSEDINGDGSYENVSYNRYAYNEAGLLVEYREDSPDWNGDGIPDYSNVTLHTYNAGGQVTAKETLYHFDGVPNGVDYRLETYTYDTKGQLAELLIDDWSLYDFVIGHRYEYNAKGQVTKEKVMDPFVFGDENYHNEATWKYNKQGQLTESNRYGEWMDDTYVLEIKDKFTYNSNGQVTKELITGQDQNWHTVEKQMVEYWYDAQGHETHRLTSFDQDLNGRWDAGTRTLERHTYNADGTLASHEIDYNTGDGFKELVETWTHFDYMVA